LEPSWELKATDFIERSWDGESVVFDQRSGDTHYLRSAAVLILDALRQGPATVDALIDRTPPLAAAAGAKDRDELRYVTKIALGDLMRLQLVGRAA
jgi:PqqD family protein of HPr-rel-A system